MRNPLTPILPVLIAGAMLLVLWQGRDDDEPSSVSASTTPSEQAPTTPASEDQPTDEDRALTVTATAEGSPAPDDGENEPVAQTNDKVFRTNARGELILDEHTRLNLEALIARTAPAELGEAKQEIARLLPPQSAPQATELIDRYNEYQSAQRQAYPPGVAPSTEDEALAELDGLHALRVAHFGPEIAKAFYGEEEALSRQLIELMRLEKDQSLTMEEKAARALQMRDSMPEIAAVERKNREED